MRTDEECNNEAAALRALAPQMPVRNLFGDNVCRHVEAQATVIEDRMSEDDVYATFDAESDDLNNGDSALLHAALDAVRWLTGDTDELPSAGWQGLVGWKPGAVL